MTEFPRYDSLPADKRMLFDKMYEESYVSLVKSLKMDNDVVVSSAKRIAAWNFMLREKAEDDAKLAAMPPIWGT